MLLEQLRRERYLLLRAAQRLDALSEASAAPGEWVDALSLVERIARTLVFPHERAVLETWRDLGLAPDLSPRLAALRGERRSLVALLRRLRRDPPDARAPAGEGALDALLGGDRATLTRALRVLGETCLRGDDLLEELRLPLERAPDEARSRLDQAAKPGPRALEDLQGELERLEARVRPAPSGSGRVRAVR